MIEVTDIGKTFDPADGPVLEEISFTLDRGSTLAIIGPSGCGKTTLLYILAGLTRPSSGRVVINGEERREPGGNTSFVLQNYGLFPWNTVYQNIVLPLKLRKTPAGSSRKISRDLMTELGLLSLRDKYPVQLSGGQQQRVAIARALASEPDFLLLDEPFSSLEALTREHLQDTILDMWQRRRLTYIIVTHSVEEAVFLGEHILVLTDRPARAAAMIRNKGFGDPSYRLHDGYFSMVKELRAVMGGMPTTGSSLDRERPTQQI